MRNLHALVAAAAFAGASLASAAEVKIIANPSIRASAISGDELKQIFLGAKSTTDDGSKAEPVIEKDGSAHEEFVKKYLGKTASALDSYYKRLLFTGQGAMPKSFSSDAEVAAYVARTKGAIGYVSAGTSTPGVKVLEVR